MNKDTAASDPAVRESRSGGLRAVIDRAPGNALWPTIQGFRCVWGNVRPSTGGGGPAGLRGAKQGPNVPHHEAWQFTITQRVAKIPSGPARDKAPQDAAGCGESKAPGQTFPLTPVARNEYE